MPKLDRLKEEVAYLKLWLGIVVVTDISLVGWLIVAVDEADRLRIVLAVLGIVLLSFGAVVLHREIDQRMERIGTL
jgi:heme O synthase-like polyprenyltransferase